MISSTLPTPPSNGLPGVTATSWGELEPIWNLRAKRTWFNGQPELAVDDRHGPAFVQWLAAAVEDQHATAVIGNDVCPRVAQCVGR